MKTKFSIVCNSEKTSFKISTVLNKCLQIYTETALLTQIKQCAVNIHIYYKFIEYKYRKRALSLIARYYIVEQERLRILGDLKR